MAYVLTTLPKSSLFDAEFRIEGARATLLEIARIFKVEKVTTVKAFSGPVGDIQTLIGNIFETGMGSTGWDHARGADDEVLAGSSNVLWEGHKWKSLAEVFGI